MYFQFVEIDILDCGVDNANHDNKRSKSVIGMQLCVAYWLSQKHVGGYNYK